MPSRTAPSGPWNGSGEMQSAALAPFIASTSPSVCRSLDMHEVLNLHFVVEAVGKHRPNRPIDQPGRERFLRRRPTFALEKAARKLAGRRLPLAVIASQRKVIHPRPRRARGHRAQRHRLAILHRASTGRLLRQRASFNDQGSAYQFSVRLEFVLTFFSFNLIFRVGATGCASAAIAQLRPPCAAIDALSKRVRAFAPEWRREEQQAEQWSME